MKKLNSNSKLRNLDYNGVGSGGGVTPEIEEEIERALLGNHVYSTIERLAGEWIDGSNIYEKTIVLEGAWSNRTTKTILEGISELVEVAYVTTNLNEDSSNYMVTRCSGGIEEIDKAFTVEKNIGGDVLAEAHDTWVNVRVIFTLKYTKDI